MGNRPELLEAWENLRHALLGPSSTLSPQLKEEVRRTLAQRTGCQFCASLGRPAEDHATRGASLAVAFTDAVARDHMAISEAQVKLLRDEFTVPQIVELLMWISCKRSVPVALAGERGEWVAAGVGDE
jgi:alkylhydroperoxidase family enzyme